VRRAQLSFGITGCPGSRSATGAHCVGSRGRDGGLRLRCRIAPAGTSVEVRDLFFKSGAAQSFAANATEYPAHRKHCWSVGAVAVCPVASPWSTKARTVWSSCPAAHTEAERLARVAKICGEGLRRPRHRTGRTDTESLTPVGDGWRCGRFRAVSRISIFAFINGAL